jgi:ankyrin repeat protein
MFDRLARFQLAWKRFQPVASLVALALFQNACVTSAEPSHTVSRKANTGLAPKEGVSVVLDTTSFLSNPQPESRHTEPATQTQGLDLSYQENLLAGCVFDALEESRPDVRTVAPERIWKAAYPQLSDEVAPRGRASWTKLIADPDFKRRVEKLSVRYLVVVGIKETLDDTESYKDGGMHIDSSGAAIGGGYFGSARTTSLKMRATVFDLANARRAGTISSTSTGTHKSTVAWAFLIIIPVAVPVFTGDTPSHSATCDELGEAIARFLNADQDLYLAVRTGSLADVERLIGKGADVNARGDNNESALLLAAENGHSAVVELLTANGADVNAMNDKDETALHLAAANGYMAVAELLVANGANVNARDYRGVTALGVAVTAGHSPIAEFLIVNGADDGLHIASANGYVATVEMLLARGADVDEMDDDNQTPLYRASFAGHTEVATLLIAHGASVNAVGRQDQTALSRAVQAGELAMAELLIARGADVEYRDRHGYAPLESAVSNGDRDMADLLIENGADVDVLERQSDRLLDAAVRYKHHDTAELLLALGADPNAENEQGNRPLHLAVQSGDQDLARILLDYGAHIDAKNADRDSPLRAAVKARDERMAGMLIAGGAAINQPGVDGITLLHIAVVGDDKDMVGLLIANGAGINAMDDLGITPLHEATRASNEDIMALLMTSGADVNARSNRGQSPLDLAVHNHDEDTLLLLLSNGADPNAADNLRRTALHHASNGDDLASARLLINHGAEVDALDIHEKTPLRYAMGNNHEEIVSLLVANGADAAKAKSNAASRYSIAVFPLGGWGAAGRYGDIISTEIGDAARDAISETDPFDLRFSYYASSADNAADIPRTESIWTGARLETIDRSKIQSLGEKYELDAVLIYTLRVGSQTGPYTTIGSRIEARLFDIRSKQVIERTADVEQALTVTKELLSEFKSTRQR